MATEPTNKNIFSLQPSVGQPSVGGFYNATSINPFMPPTFDYNNHLYSEDIYNPLGLPLNAITYNPSAMPTGKPTTPTWNPGVPITGPTMTSSLQIPKFTSSPHQWGPIDSDSTTNTGSGLTSITLPTPEMDFWNTTDTPTENLFNNSQYLTEKDKFLSTLETDPNQRDVLPGDPTNDATNEFTTDTTTDTAPTNKFLPWWMTGMNASMGDTDWYISHAAKNAQRAKFYGDPEKYKDFEITADQAKKFGTASKVGLATNILGGALSAAKTGMAHAALGNRNSYVAQEMARRRRDYKTGEYEYPTYNHLGTTGMMGGSSMYHVKDGGQIPEMENGGRALPGTMRHDGSKEDWKKYNNYEKNRERSTELTDYQLAAGGHVTPIYTDNPFFEQLKDGGKIIEVENNEYVLKEDPNMPGFGSVKRAVGPTHEQKQNKDGNDTGIYTYAEGGEKIISDNIEIGQENYDKYIEELPFLKGKITPKSTFAKTMAAFDEASGVTGLYDKMANKEFPDLEKTEKLPTHGAHTENTKDVNRQFLAGNIKNLSDSAKPLEQFTYQYAQEVFDDQERNKQEEKFSDFDGQNVIIPPAKKGGKVTKIPLTFRDGGVYTSPENLKALSHYALSKGYGGDQLDPTEAVIGFMKDIQQYRDGGQVNRHLELINQEKSYPTPSDYRNPQIVEGFNQLPDRLRSSKVVQKLNQADRWLMDFFDPNSPFQINSKPEMINPYFYGGQIPQHANGYKVPKWLVSPDRWVDWQTAKDNIKGGVGRLMEGAQNVIGEISDYTGLSDWLHNEFVPPLPGLSPFPIQQEVVDTETTDTEVLDTDTGGGDDTGGGTDTGGGDGTGGGTSDATEGHFLNKQYQLLPEYLDMLGWGSDFYDRYADKALGTRTQSGFADYSNFYNFVEDPLETESGYRSHDFNPEMIKQVMTAANQWYFKDKGDFDYNNPDDVMDYQRAWNAKIGEDAAKLAEEQGLEGDEKNNFIQGYITDNKISEDGKIGPELGALMGDTDTETVIEEPITDEETTDDTGKETEEKQDEIQTTTPSGGGAGAWGPQTYLRLPYRHMPMGLQGHAWGTLGYDQLDPSKLSPEMQLVENQRQISAGMDMMSQMGGPQAAANMGMLLAQKANADNQAIQQTAQANLASAQQTAQINAELKRNADISNLAAMMDYDQKSLTALDKTHKDIGNYLETKDRDRIQRDYELWSLATLNTIYPQYAAGRHGVGFTGDPVPLAYLDQSLTGAEREELYQREKAKAAGREAGKESAG